MKMAEPREHVPHAAKWRHDLSNKESRLAGPVGVPLLQRGVMASSHHDDGRMSSLLELALPEGIAPLTYAVEARYTVS